MELEKYLDVSNLSVDEIKFILTKYDTEFPKTSENKTFLKFLYNKNKIADKIKETLEKEKDQPVKMKGRKRIRTSKKDQNPIKKQKTSRNQTIHPQEEMKLSESSKMFK